MSYFDDLINSAPSFDFNLDLGNSDNLKNLLSSSGDSAPSFGGRYDFSDIVRDATEGELFDPSNMGFYGDAKVAPESELYDPANKGFYGDYQTATDKELSDPANQGFYKTAEQPGIDYLGRATGLLESLLGGGKKAISTLTGASGSNDISQGLELALLLAALTSKKFGSSRDTGYKGSIPMDMVANRKEYAQAPRAYGEGAKGQKYSDVTYAAHGGIMGLAHGGRAKNPRYLEGATDGMADQINTSIDGHQPAKLSHGEFVIPADVVSHLGNGNSTAGANELYKMMDRVRQARTGTKKQGKQIKAKAFTPGAKKSRKVKNTFLDGGSVSTTSNISPFVGDYIAQTLGKANALSNAPIPNYTGQLTAGTSPLEKDAFADASKLTGSMNDFGTVQSYMNPYINSVMNQQSDEARRQAGITQTGINSQATQQNAFGGSRSALMSAENNRNLGTNLANIQSAGLNRAYDNAMNQQAQAGQYGLNALTSKLGAGAVQRGIEQDSLTALKNQFDKQATAPFDMLKWRLGMLGNIPVGSTTATVNTSPYSDILGGLGSAAGILK